MTVTAAVLAKASSDNVTPGVLGFLVVAGIGLALWFLLKSMSKQLRKIPPPPPEAEDGETGSAQAKPLSPLQAAAARRRAAAAAEKAGKSAAGGSPDPADRLR